MPLYALDRSMRVILKSSLLTSPPPFFNVHVWAAHTVINDIGAYFSPVMNTEWWGCCTPYSEAQTSHKYANICTKYERVAFIAPQNWGGRPIQTRLPKHTLFTFLLFQWSSYPNHAFENRAHVILYTHMIYINIHNVYVHIHIHTHMHAHARKHTNLHVQTHKYTCMCYIRHIIIFTIYFPVCTA